MRHVISAEAGRSAGVGSPRRASTRRQRLLDWIATIPILLLLPALLLPFVPAGASGALRYVSPFGSDADTGTLDHPWRTVRRGLTSVTPGDTLYLRGGIYVENLTGMTIRKGTLDQPITVERYPGERPVIQGLLWLTAPDYWTLDGIDVTWNPANTDPTKHMVKMINGTGWTFRNAELWGAKSFAALLVAGTNDGLPAQWTVSHNCIHDTYPSNDKNQDHNVYVNTGLNAGSGIIERNVMFNATNGMNIKLGGPSSTSGGAAQVTVRYNTLYNAAQNVLVNWASHSNELSHNIVGRLSGTNTVYGNVRGYELVGQGNTAFDNIGFAANRFSYNDAASVPGVQDGGGNLFPLDPLFDAVTSCAGFHPANPLAAPFGHLAPPEGAASTETEDPGSAASPAETATPSPGLTEAAIPSAAVTAEPATMAPSPPPTSPPTSPPTPSPTPSPTVTDGPAPLPDPTPADTPTPTSAASAATNISLRSASSASSPSAANIAVDAPAGVAAGDALLASVDTTGGLSVTPPSGWVLVRRDASGRGLLKSTFVRIAGGSEPATYTWSFSRGSAAVATILSFTGVDTHQPIAASSGRATSRSTQITAPSLTLSEPSTLVGFYAMAAETAIEPPAGMRETSDRVSEDAARSVTGESAVEPSTTTGVSGKKVASAGREGRNIGQLVALRAAT